MRAYEENVRYVHTDVRRRKDLENAITASVVEFGDVPDIYIANAGVFEPVSMRATSLILLQS